MDENYFGVNNYFKQITQIQFLSVLSKRTI